MINAQNFSYPSIDKSKLINRENITPDVFPKFKIISIVWKSILGDNNKELAINSMINSQKFRAHVEKVRADFKVNVNNFSRYPKLRDKDWE